MNIDKLREEIAADEGRRNAVYLCTEQKRTVGIGHLITADDPEWPMEVGDTISDERINEMFETDIAVTIDDCRIIFRDFDGFPEEAQLCLANMCFQLGRPTFSKFKKSIGYANEHMWGQLAEEILDSRWAKQTPNRAQRISDRLSLIEVPT